MDKALFYHIADVIQANRSWIEVIDTHDTIQWNYCLNGEFHHIDYQVITLRNFATTGTSTVGRSLTSGKSMSTIWLMV